MKRLITLFAFSVALVGLPMGLCYAANAHGQAHGSNHGGNHGIGTHGFGHGFGGLGRGFMALGVGGDYEYGWDIADLYRQLYQNLPYFALHPPVYYSQPVPRTYGYSPFAYPPGVMTPDVVEETKPVTIINPYVPTTKPASTETKTDRSASTSNSPKPLVIINPFAAPNRAVAKSGS
jgi:hypothetical protein